MMSTSHNSCSLNWVPTALLMRQGVWLSKVVSSQSKSRSKFIFVFHIFSHMMLTMYSVLRRYIQDYVSCKTCRQLNTVLSKGENRLWYLTCQSCGSTRTVPAIKTGFSAQIGKRKRMQG